MTHGLSGTITGVGPPTYSWSRRGVGLQVIWKLFTQRWYLQPQRGQDSSERAREAYRAQRRRKTRKKRDKEGIRGTKSEREHPGLMETITNRDPSGN